MDTNSQAILKLARKRGVLRSRDLRPLGLPRVALTRLVRRGSLDRIGRGLYTLSGKSISEHIALAEVTRKYPRGVICLLSALRFHNLTTQSPFEVWLAIPNKARTPQLQNPPLRVIRFSGVALKLGIEQHQVGNVDIRVTGIARTVADCFKYRNKIGLDVALEALRESRRKNRCSVDELWHYAKILRVSNVMRPYLESLP